MSNVNPSTQPPTGLPSAQSQLGSGVNPAIASTGMFGAGQQLAAGVVTSPYEYPQLESSRVILGAQMAAMLGLSSSANTPIEISQVLDAFSALSIQQQTAIEQLLLAGHFYIDTNGDPMQNPPQPGSNSQYNQIALANSLLDTFNSNTGAAKGGTTLSSKVNSAIYSGAAGLPMQPEPVLGGGQAYQVNLTSPQDLYDQLYTTFESTLGRAPSQKELNNFVNLFQQQQATYQQALNQQQEQVTKTHFQAQETQRNLQLGYTQTPFVSQGPVPNGPFHSAGAWASAFLQWNDMPVTQSSVSLLLTVIQKMGGWAKAQQSKNPLGTVGALPGPSKTVSPKGTNPQAPSTFQSWGEGMQATIDSLNRAGYGGILEALRLGIPIPANAAATVGQELSQWTNGKITSVPKASAAISQQAHVAAAAVAKSTSALNKKNQTPPPGHFSMTAPPQPVPRSQQAVGTPQNSEPAMGFEPGKGIAPQKGARNVAGPEQPAPATTPTATPPNPNTAPTTTTPPVAPQAATTPVATPGAAPATPKAQRGAQATGLAQRSHQRATDTSKGKQQSKALPPLPKPWTPPPNVGQAPYSGSSISPLNLTQGQNQYSTGDIYIGPNTLQATESPSATGAAFTAATTGANTMPYIGNQYLNAFSAVADMIASGRAA